MLHFFRSDAWNLERVRSKWAEIVGEKFPLFEKAGHCFLVGDGTKQAKEGRHMPGVKKLAQESETQSKPEDSVRTPLGMRGRFDWRREKPFLRSSQRPDSRRPASDERLGRLRSFGGLPRCGNDAGRMQDGASSAQRQSLPP